MNASQIYEELLHEAETAIYNNENLEKEIVMESDPNELCEEGANILMYAVSKGWTDVVKSFLERGANVNHRCDNEASALFIAAIDKNLDMLKLLLDNEAEINAQNIAGETVLYQCCCKNEFEVAEFLLKRKAKPDIKNVEGGNALIESMARGHLNIVELLLKYGADANLEFFKQKWHSLFFALMYKNNKAVELLIKYGANVQKQDSDGDTVLHHAAVKDDNFNTYSMLIRKEAQDTIPNNKGMTASMIVLNRLVTKRYKELQVAPANIISGGTHGSLVMGDTFINGVKQPPPR